jgi:hypothetical protein
MSRFTSVLSAVDYSAPLDLELNEITVLMALNSVGIIAIMVLSVYVAAAAFFSKTDQGEIADSHFSRS